MSLHIDRLRFEFLVSPSVDPVASRTVQELLGRRYGKEPTLMNYTCRPLALRPSPLPTGALTLADKLRAFNAGNSVPIKWDEENAAWVCDISMTVQRPSKTSHTPLPEGKASEKQGSI
jgi:hypothetical protein